MILKNRSISRKSLLNDVSRPSLHRCTKGRALARPTRPKRDCSQKESFPKISFAVPGVNRPVLAHSSRVARMASHRSCLGRTEAVPCVCATLKPDP